MPAQAGIAISGPSCPDGRDARRSHGRRPVHSAAMLKEMFGSEGAQLAVRWALVVVTALAILLVGIVLARWLAGLVRKGVMRKANDAALAGFVATSVYVLLCAVVIVGALDQLGVPTASLIAALGAAGLAVGLALKDSLGNLASGVLIVFTRPFRAGDVVEAGGRTGVVERVDLLNTVLSTPDNSVVTLPNAAIMSQPIVNFSARPQRRLELSFIVASSERDPLDAVGLIERTLRAHPRVLAEPPCQVLLQRLAEGGVEIIARPWVRTAELPGAQGDVLAAVGAALLAAGFTAPQRSLRLVSPATPPIAASSSRGAPEPRP
jgi:small conductance mechanosensitive channel